MSDVKILVDSVGEWNAGDVVIDAPAGLLEIARNQVRNAATGELLAEIIEDDSKSLDYSEREQKLQSDLDESKKRENELLVQIAELQSQIQGNDSDDEMKDLKAKAKELKIQGYTKMSIDELKEAIAAGGEGDAE